MKILAKDDCFSYYLSLALMRAGHPCTLSCYDEKIPSYIILDALAGMKADPAIVNPWLINPYCFRRQQTLACLAVVGANLITIGSFADLTIKGYRHKEHGWKFFEIRHCIGDHASVDATCERLPLLPIGDVLSNNLKLFQHFQHRNPQAKPMWINYPYIDGATTEWEDAFNPIPNRVMRSRWEELTEAATVFFPKYDIFVLNIPDAQVRRRDGDLLWHYHDSTYDYAAKTVLDWFTSTHQPSPSTPE